MDHTLKTYRAVLAHIDAARPFAIALVLDTEGSAPRAPGTIALVDASGAVCGTIGGGAVEAEAQRRAIEACRAGRPFVFELSLTGSRPADDAPICGGSMRVLLDPTAAKHRAAYAEAVALLEGRERGALVTTVTHGDEVAVSVECVRGDCVPMAAPRVGVDILIDRLEPAPRLLIAGGGHIGQALAVQADLLGFDVTVADDRPEFTDAARYPEGVAARCGDIAAQVAAFPMERDTFVVIVTRGHAQDAAALAACIRSPAAYVGMIGSRRKTALLREDFIASGRATAEEFDRVFAPIGLAIGAVTVPEIATSIAAQLVAARRKGAAAARAGSMAERPPGGPAA